MNRFKSSALALLGVGAVTGGALLAYARFVEPRRFEVVRWELHLRRLDPAFDGYRIVQLSDLHLDGVTTPERLLDVMDIANDLQPDLAVITGDFVTGNVHFDGTALSEVLAALHAPDGKFGVLGNHDRKTHINAVRRAMAEGGVAELENAVHTIHRGDAALHIAGVDSFYRRRARLDLVLNALPDDGVAILLAHEPDFADVAAPTGRFDLQLSGHAHGGQVVVPFFTRFGLPRYGERYVSGMRFVGGMLVNANRGIGMTSAPLRFNCRPEITLFTLRSG